MNYSKTPSLAYPERYHLRSRFAFGRATPTFNIRAETIPHDTQIISKILSGYNYMERAMKIIKHKHDFCILETWLVSCLWHRVIFGRTGTEMAFLKTWWKIDRLVIPSLYSLEEMSLEWCTTQRSSGPDSWEMQTEMDFSNNIIERNFPLHTIEEKTGRFRWKFSSNNTLDINSDFL